MACSVRRPAILQHFTKPTQEFVSDENGVSQPFIEDDAKEQHGVSGGAATMETRASSKWTNILLVTNLITLVLSAFLLPRVIWQAQDLQCQDPSLGSVWSPAYRAIEYQTQTRSRVLEGETEYMGYPDATKDELWENLNKYELITVGPEDASSMLVKPSNRPEAPDSYSISLEVYHQLHCLRMLRMGVYPEYYHLNKTELREHSEHCIENLRTAIMCHADPTPIPFQLNGTIMMPPETVTSTCRDFDAINRWAAEHQSLIYT